MTLMAGRDPDPSRDVALKPMRFDLGQNWGRAERQLSAIRSRKRTDGCREEFRAPAGVRKSPRKEPAAHRAMSMGILTQPKLVADAIDRAAQDATAEVR